MKSSPISVRGRPIMLLLDRYIITRFLVNFIILFTLLFVFATTIDLILNLDRFIDAARDIVAETEAALESAAETDVARVIPGEESRIAISVELVKLIADFQLPRIFQFYAYLHGLVAIGAMAFTLAQMHRFKELVAVMASGISLYRIAVPFMVVVFGLSLIQMANQELILPNVAPLVLRGHGQIGQSSVNEFEIQLTTDARGAMFQAPSFDPGRNALVSPTIIERDATGLTTRRITAREAFWDEGRQAWRLDEGRAMSLQQAEGPRDASVRVTPIEYYETDLDPRLLLINRYGEFAAMLSLRQISQMLDSNAVSEINTLLRYRYARFASVLINLLVLGLTLPCFLLREPANLMRQSLLCAGLALPAMLGAAIGMMVDLPGIPPAAGVFLPVIILMVVALVPWTQFKT
ncbi:MAG: LptF/LptG family permease [Phycisphaerales bacterium]|nr:MAG: LptF/LptG family permease [Phycisphaerales bacterium]